MYVRIDIAENGPSNDPKSVHVEKLTVFKDSCQYAAEVRECEEDA